MFTAKFESAEMVKKIVDALRDLIEISSIQVTKKGISLQGIDSSKVSVVSLHLDAKDLAKFDCPKKLRMTARTISLHRVLKCAEFFDKLDLSKSAEQNRLTLKFKSLGGNKTSVFNLNLINNAEEDIEIPNIQASSRVVLPAEEFAKIIRELAQITEAVEIEVAPKHISFGVKNDMIAGNIELKESFILRESETIKIEVKKKQRAVYSLELLNHFARASSFAQFVYLHFSEEAPLSVEVKIHDHGFLKYHLAPKLD